MTASECDAERIPVVVAPFVRLENKSWPCDSKTIASETVGNRAFAKRALDSLKYFFLYLLEGSGDIRTPAEFGAEKGRSPPCRSSAPIVFSSLSSCPCDYAEASAAHAPESET
jgi:hypothetical protein